MDLITVGVLVSIIVFAVVGWLFRIREVFRIAVGYFPIAVMFKIMSLRGEHLTSFDLWIMWVVASVFSLIMSFAVPSRREKKMLSK